jgi:2-dehydropantoate 2-reductase
MTHKNNPHIAIVGAGSIGCYLGGCLAVAGAKLSLIGRVRIYQQIDTYGLQVSDYKGREAKIELEKLDFSTSMQSIAAADYVLLTVKSGDTKQAALDIKSYLKADAVIVSMQNGIRNVDVLSEVLPEHTVLKGMVPFNVLSKGKGQFHCGTEGDLAIEVKADEHLALVQAFSAAELPVTLYNDIRGVQWGKLVMNLNNSVNALSGAPLLEQLNDREYRKVMTKVVSEALDVLKVAGITPARTGKVIPKLTPYILALPNFLFKRVASATLKIDPQARSSMYEDFVLKRKTEIDYLNGEIVLLAQQHQTTAPVNKVIVELVKKAQKQQQGSPQLSAKFLQHAIS